MEIEFDPAKNTKNIKNRGLSFEKVKGFDFSSAFYEEDTRFDYGETRIRAIGWIDVTLYALVFTETDLGVRVISLRKATKYEKKNYEQNT